MDNFSITAYRQTVDENVRKDFDKAAMLYLE